MSQPWSARFCARFKIVFVSLRMELGPNLQIARAVTVGLLQCFTSQSKSFSVGEAPSCSIAFSVSGGGRPSRSNRFATAIVLSVFRRDHRKRSAVDDFIIRSNRLIDFDFMVLSEVYDY
jgi:hypothetical protein